MIEIDEVVQKTMDHITTHGWAVTGVFGDEAWASFSYSTGLTNFSHPELVVTGLPVNLAGIVINLVGERIRSGAVFTAGDQVNEVFDDDYPAAFITARTRDTERPLALSNLIYPRCSALQIVWPDSLERFPWEPGYETPSDVQPLLGMALAGPPQPTQQENDRHECTNPEQRNDR